MFLQTRCTFSVRTVLLGTLGASLLGDLLTKNLSGRGVIRAGEGTT